MKAEFYVQFQATRSSPRGKVREIRAARMTQRAPWEPVPDSAIVRFEVEIPDHAFAIPTVKIELPVDPDGLPIVEAEGVGVMLPVEEEEPAEATV